MSLDDHAGAVYGPFPVRVTAEQVAAYVAVTGDDDRRWVEHAPPSFAGALLFAAAPAFLHDPEVAPYTKLLVHADQSFAWQRALRIDEQVTVDGVVARVRARGDVTFVTFEAAVRSEGEAVIEAVSTFLMGDAAAGAPAAEEDEPPVDRRGPNDPLSATGAAAMLRLPLARSASRLDLVRYAAASGDFNPVHFDHATARRAGFAGVLVHGLLMGAWVLQVAAAQSAAPDGVASARLRFKNPLRPAVPVAVTGEVVDPSAAGPELRLRVTGGETDYVDARVRLRSA